MRPDIGGAAVDCDTGSANLGQSLATLLGRLLALACVVSGQEKASLAAQDTSPSVGRALLDEVLVAVSAVCS